MKIALYGRNYSDAYYPIYKSILKEIEERDISLVVFSDLWDQVRDKIVFASGTGIYNTCKDLGKDTDFVFSIGGDGTLLNTITLVKDSSIPVLGFNAGRLGFLSSVNEDEVSTVFDLLEKGKFSLDRRSLITLETKVDLFGSENFAMNEVCIHRKDTSSMVSIHAYVDNVFLNTYWADGLIVSTPTGSTAYSLSCGGPILTPDSQNFIITPVSTHNLTVRPIVVPDSSQIRITAAGRESAFFVSLDSRSVAIDATVELNIRKSEYYINLVKLPGKNFFNTIREKLMWGMDKRN